MEFLEALGPWLPLVAVLALMIGLLGTLGWIYLTRLRIEKGYPLENSWGKAIYPKRDDETIERIKLLSQENAQLRAELGSIKDRLANVERIVTDDGHRVSAEIEKLRLPN